METRHAANDEQARYWNADEAAHWLVHEERSAPMLRRAARRARQDGLTNARFEHGDAQVHAFRPAAGDVAISRFGVMFFADPAGAFGNIVRGFRPGGRLAFVCWQN